MKKIISPSFVLIVFTASCAHKAPSNSDKVKGAFFNNTPSTRAVANGSERGGGDALYCSKGPFGKKYYFADTYALFNSDKKEVFDRIENWVPKEHHRAFVVELISLGIDPKHREEFLKMAMALVQNFKVVEVDELEDIDDDNITVPEGCTRKVQLAVNDIYDFKIRVKKDVYKELTNIEKEFLLVHEVFIFTYYFSGVNIWDMNAIPTFDRKFDTTQIRNFLKNLAEGSQFAAWFEGFKSFASLPGLRIYGLLLDAKFFKYRDSKKSYKINLGKSIETEDVFDFSNKLQYKILHTPNIWLQNESKDIERGWRQVYSAIINDDKKNNIGIIEISCQRHLSSLDFDFVPRAGQRRLIESRPPIENGSCAIEKLL